MSDKKDKKPEVKDLSPKKDAKGGRGAAEAGAQLSGSQLQGSQNLGRPNQESRVNQDSRPNSAQ
ncbi:MAG: hypothetical protein ACR2HH_09700 [Chthoniobacterales bacterium]